ncbi:A disintegrin and metalloproteinase with thrombospondin motifs adt-1-like 1 [Homarus americanus]|uniref:A disintegrin and metalloproteinase with thrombospondin motifs adt-1-like 1 n=1 Tax=Homarus americanus TaxID=6706 RepID=A0A8J5TJX3_HOMAM|nr:A disintegrin and metalloproteinase with thrombospondin motifs adt-1-like 1 [Homarus americanus]
METASYVALVTILVLVGPVAALPQQQAEALPGLRWSEAVVEVTLTKRHAPTDPYSHANIRDSTPNSLLKVTMENKLYELHLEPTSWLVSPGASIVRVGSRDSSVRGATGDFQPLKPRPCFYLAKPNLMGDKTTSGTVSLCHSDGPGERRGRLILKEKGNNKLSDHVMLMVDDELAELLPILKVLGNITSSSSALPPTVSKRGEAPLNINRFTHVVKRHPLPATDGVTRVTETTPDPLTVELGIILDQALIDTFADYLNNDQELIDLALGLVNNVQALYRHPSLGRRVDLTITHMRLLNKQPEDLPTHNGDRIKLLKSFCSYSQRHNIPEDSHPEHWDIGVYLSGLNFFTMTPEGSVDGVTMGLAFTGGVCKIGTSCLINELGAVNFRGRPYPSSGALSSYVLAHEVGHSLGLRHDGVSNECQRSGFIMAAGRGVKGATTWSSCAREKILKQSGDCVRERGAAAAGGAAAAAAAGAAGGAAAGDGEASGLVEAAVTSTWNHSVYKGLPGQRWDASAQCQLFLRDRYATVADTSRINEICNTVTCISPTRISTYLAGPALEGTHCGGKNWCQGGQCVPWGNEGPEEVVVGGWGPWTHAACASGCVKGATGYKISHRLCDSPMAKNSVKGCVGSQVEVSLCPDDKVCGETPRKTVNELASELCKVVSTMKTEIDPVGRQLSYSEDMAWQACALYCQRKNSTDLWTPRHEFKDTPHVATHLPDGTPCNVGQYVCLNRQCVSRMPQVRHAGIINSPSPDHEGLDPEPPGDLRPIDRDDLFF